MTDIGMARFRRRVTAGVALALAASLFATAADAAWVCRRVDGKRKCGMEQTRPVPSAVPAPGISPTGQPGARPKPAKPCTTQGGLQVCP
jgi:hypothetical protein